ncbi:MAG: molybdopterin-dependent oxidoreductase [Chloroflexi bacterium]|nr:molybdopterin-dependent oxidoreductase [Chloroflexota bacterium]
MRPRLTVPAALFAGAVATGPALLVLVIARLVFGVPGALEVVADGTLRFVPLPAFDAAIAAFGSGAKGGLAVGVAVGAVGAGAALGPIALRVAGDRPPARTGLLAAGFALALVELVVLPIAGAGLLGTQVADPLALQVPLVVAALAYGLTLAGIAATWPAGTPTPVAAAAPPGAPAPAAVPPSDAPDPSRRTLLRRTALAVGGISLAGAFGIVGWRAASAARSSAAAPAPTTPPSDPFGPTPALTPVGTFYTVSKNLGSPSVDGATWRLSVEGLVDRPFALGLDDLRAMPSAEDHRTLMCISYDLLAGDRYIGNQRWRGFPVADLLDRAGVRPEARFVVWRSADDYAESLPIDVARDPGTWIVFEMDGRPLDADHGFPARVLIPDRFGMKGPKWLTGIVLGETNEPGYWVERGWDAEAFEKIMSRIDLPQAGDAVPAGTPFPVTGIAFAGDRGLSRVEVSADGGETWTEARLEDATTTPLGPLTWVRFRAEVTAARPGRASLLVRATDGTGALQVEEPTPPLPDGATGWHRVDVVAG